MSCHDIFVLSEAAEGEIVVSENSTTSRWNLGNNGVAHKMPTKQSLEIDVLVQNTKLPFSITSLNRWD
jgi:hypothetical protein